MRADIKASPGKELGMIFCMEGDLGIKQWGGSVTWACKGLKWKVQKKVAQRRAERGPWSLGGVLRGSRMEMEGRG